MARRRSANAELSPDLPVRDMERPRLEGSQTARASESTSNSGLARIAPQLRGFAAGDQTELRGRRRNCVRQSQLALIGLLCSGLPWLTKQRGSRG
jgi:hypothetical protein